MLMQKDRRPFGAKTRPFYPKDLAVAEKTR